MRNEKYEKNDKYERNERSDGEGTGSTESKIEKEILLELLMDLGLTDSALQESITKLSNSSMTEIIQWLQTRKQKDYIFSGLSHFSTSTTDHIPAATSTTNFKIGNNWMEGSVKGSGSCCWNMICCGC